MSRRRPLLPPRHRPACRYLSAPPITMPSTPWPLAWTCSYLPPWLLPVPPSPPRYTPNLSRKCTHVLVDPSCDLATEKLLSLRADRFTWRQEVVTLQWLDACKAGGARVGEVGFRALQVRNCAGVQKGCASSGRLAGHEWVRRASGHYLLSGKKNDGIGYDPNLTNGERSRSKGLFLTSPCCSWPGGAAPA